MYGGCLLCPLYPLLYYIYNGCRNKVDLFLSRAFVFAPRLCSLACSTGRFVRGALRDDVLCCRLINNSQRETGWKFAKLWKVLKTGFLAFFNRVKMHYLAIFLPNSIVTGMPYLPAKDEVVSFDRFSSRGFWKWYNSEVWRFLNGDYMAWTQHFSFCRFSRRRKFFGKFDCDFLKFFTKEFFLTEYEEFWNFIFDGEFAILFFTDSCSLDCGKFKLIISCFSCDNRTTLPMNCYCENSYGLMNLFFFIKAWYRIEISCSMPLYFSSKDNSYAIRSRFLIKS